MVKLIDPPSRENITTNKGHIDLYTYHIGSGVIYVARSWPRKPKHPSKSFLRSHKASSILLYAYRNYAIEFRAINILYWKKFNESPLDYFRYFNQSFCYFCPTLPHISHLEIKNVDNITRIVTFSIKCSSNDPWLIRSQYLDTDNFPGFFKVIRNRYGSFKAHKVTRSIPPNIINPIQSIPPFHTFKVPFNSFNVPICNIPKGNAKFQPSSFPLTGFMLSKML